MTNLNMVNNPSKLNSTDFFNGYSSTIILW